MGLYAPRHPSMSTQKYTNNGTVSGKPDLCVFLKPIVEEDACPTSSPVSLGEAMREPLIIYNIKATSYAKGP